MPEGHRHGAGGAAEPGSSPDFAGLIGDLTLAVGHLTDASRREVKPRIPFEACKPAPILSTILITAGAGTLGVTQDNFGPTEPYYWDLRSVSATGFTAGTVTMYRNIIGGEVLATWPSAGEFTWSLQKILAPSDDLVWQATGITLAAGAAGVAIAGQAIEIESAWFPEYAV